MHRQLLRPMSALVLALTAGAAAPAAPPVQIHHAVVNPAPPATQVTRALQHLRSLKGSLGLTAQADFQLRHAFLNAQGATVVHLVQTHLGSPVWGGAAIVHLSAEGLIQGVRHSAKANIQLAGAPALSPEQAVAAALRNLAPKGALEAAPTVSQMVFPASEIGGFKTKIDPATGRTVLDRELSVWARPGSAPYVWAYQVTTQLNNPRDGQKAMVTIIDGDTGAVLKKWNDLRSDSPAQGSGNGFYSGVVTLTTTQSSADSTFAMVDPSRGAVLNPYTNTTGLTVLYDQVIQSFGMPMDQPALYGESPSNNWGDGMAFAGNTVQTNIDLSINWAGANTANGQTNAVDAQYGMAEAWDLFQNVFNRQGPDGAGGSYCAIVHPFAPTTGSQDLQWDKHIYSAFGNTIVLGDGTYPGNPNGKISQCEIDIVGHEMGHGFANSAGNFFYQGESGAIEEATADIIGKLTQSYALRPPSADTTIPEFPTQTLDNWTIGLLAGRGTPERYLYQPSLDGVSPDGWFDGMSGLLPWYSSGPLNRMFFFLAEGSSTTASDPTHSIYLPGGMTGIGLDKAARIWYKAVTENLLPTDNLLATLPAADAAATEIYGAGSVEELAVLSAFAAVNIGDLPGQPPHVLITFPVVHAAGSLLDTGDPNSFLAGATAQMQFFPPATRVIPRISVLNTSNTAVTWSLGSVYDGELGGVVNADGSWTTPQVDDLTPGPYILKAVSQADPSQFAKGSMFIVNIDADGDGQADALDLGEVAMAWGLTDSANPYPWASIWDSNGGIGDWDLALFEDVLTHTWPAV